MISKVETMAAAHCDLTSLPKAKDLPIISNHQSFSKSRVSIQLDDLREFKMSPNQSFFEFWSLSAI